MTRPSIHSGHGFSLVELSIVLIIVALLLGGLLPTLSALINQQRTAETQRILTETRDALIGYAIINGRLPRPATSAVIGTERAACSNASDCAGFIPWTTLGTTKLDSWGKIIRYSVTPDFAGGGSGTEPFTLSSTIATKTIQTDSGTSTYLAGQGTCLTSNQCVPAVIFSHGKNNFGTGDSGNAFANNSTTNTDETTNNDLTTDNFFSRIASDNPAAGGGEFDDLVVWIPLTVLLNRMVASGRLP